MITAKQANERMREFDRNPVPHILKCIAERIEKNAEVGIVTVEIYREHTKTAKKTLEELGYSVYEEYSHSDIVSILRISWYDSK